MTRLLPILLITIFLSPLPALAEKRIALIVGNSDYAVGPLENPKRDATLMAATLAEVGFEVTHLENANLREFQRGLVDFIRALQVAGEDSVGLFYYAGHGIQSEGENYLVPVDADLRDVLDLRIQTLDTSTIMASLRSAGNRLNLVILDACRNNPFRSATRSGTGGLAQVDAPSGTLVAYSTAPGSVAEDGSGRNSPYSLALAKAIRQPGQAIEQVFKQVRIEVMEKTGSRQIPWESSSLTGDFFFMPPVEQTSVEVTPTTPESGQAPSQDDKEMVFWLAIQESTNPKSFEAYLQAYPNGAFAPLAQLKIAELSAEEPTVELAEGPTEPEETGSEQRTQAAVGLNFEPGQEFRDCADCPSLTVVPSGGFTMGSPETEEGRLDNEGPTRPVQVEKPFAIGTREVTVREFQAFVEDTGYDVGDECWTYENGEGRYRADRNWRNPGFEQTPEDPVVCVSWRDAQAYVEWLRSVTGNRYRLPSEAEWEYAARAGSETRYFFGNDRSGGMVCRYGNGADMTAKATYVRWTTSVCDDGALYTAPGGSYAPNGFGLYDTLGNAAEWTQDCWNDGYWDAPGNTLALDYGNCTLHPVRGQAWSGTPRGLRSAYREAFEAPERDQNIGFRVARAVE